jgi:hypothetical protein
MAVVWPHSMRAQTRRYSRDTLPVSVVQRGMEAYNRHDLEASAALYDSTVVLESLGDSAAARRFSRTEMRESIREWFQQAPNCKVTLVKRIATGPFVVELYDLDANGKRSRHIDMFEVRHGKIVREWQN